jgi:iron complex outermembrane receptor protein
MITSRPLLLLALGAVSLQAQTAPPLPLPAGNDEPVRLDALVTTGTRFNGRLVAESRVPVDVISADDLRAGGETDLQRMLKARVPAFSLPNSVGTGTPDFLGAPTLRGLGIGQMLVLVNGKRRHTTGDVSLGQQIGRGDVGYDFNAIPYAALAHVEVLRDGAAAQYGSDAIAGVINLIMDKSVGGRFDARIGSTTRGDGEVLDFNASYGARVGQTGVLRATIYRHDHDSSDRSGLDTRQQYFGSNGTVMPSDNFGSGVGLTPANGTLDPREASIDRRTFRFGSSAYVNQGFFLNGELPLDSSATFYAFGGMNRVEGLVPSFFRRAAQDQTVRAIHPNGFLPWGPYDLHNHSLSTGVKGRSASGWTWDLSTVYGGNRIENRYSNANNPSFGTASPTDVYRGGTRFAQWTTNLDLTREIALGAAAPLRVAFGLEHREEFYRILAGEPASYENGGVPILDGPNTGRPAPIGIQPAAGYRPSDVADVDRSATAVYLDFERHFASRLLLSAAARYEDYSDFGDNATFKAAGRFQLLAPLALRASVSTGFRAPHLAQSWFATSSSTVVNGVLVASRLLAVSDPVAKVLGASPLRPEESINQSAGFVFTHGRFSVSLDAFRIRVRDRIALSSNFTGAAVTNLLASAGFPNIGTANFMTNAVDTDTRGAELVLRYRQPLREYGHLTATLGAMRNTSEFDRISPAPKPLTDLGITIPLFDLTQQVRFTTSQPRDKYILGLDWDWGKWSVNLTNIRYGEVESVAFTSLTPARIAAVTQGYRYRLAPTAPASGNFQVIQRFDPKIITDLELSYRFTPRLTLSAGANNLFDIQPTRNFPSTAASVAAGTNGADNFGTQPYNYVSPFDWNGTTLFAKATWKF